jgi:hypothetical protein
MFCWRVAGATRATFLFNAGLKDSPAFIGSPAQLFQKIMTRSPSRAGVLIVVFGCLAQGIVSGQSTLPDAPSAVLGQAGGAPTGVPDNSLIGEPGAGRASSPCVQDASVRMPCNMCCVPRSERFERFLNFAGDHATTPRNKFWLAARNTLDPFNALTILGISAISVGTDSHSAYGPGFRGFARNSGVVFTEGVTSEFIGTFLVPSLVGQDPHYHRMPNASTRRRIAHAIYQVVWTQSDTGKPMFNYATVFGTIATDAVNDLYVPGRELGPGSSAARIGTAIATDPIDNFITEFVPDLARRVKFHVVFVQRVINRVALEEGRNAAD